MGTFLPSLDVTGHQEEHPEVPTPLVNQGEVTPSGHLLWPSQKVLPKDDSGKRLLGESRHVEGFQCCRGPGMWDPPQSHQLDREVPRHQPLQGPSCSPRPGSPLLPPGDGLTSSRTRVGFEPLDTAPGQRWEPAPRAGTGRGRATRSHPTQPSLPVRPLGEVAGGTGEHRLTFTGHPRGPLNKCKDL